jgi:hypothetical protein
MRSLLVAFQIINYLAPLIVFSLGSANTEQFFGEVSIYLPLRTAIRISSLAYSACFGMKKVSVFPWKCRTQDQLGVLLLRGKARGNCSPGKTLYSRSLGSSVSWKVELTKHLSIGSFLSFLCVNMSYEELVQVDNPYFFAVSVQPNFRNRVS